MSDGGRDRASLGVKVWKSSQKWSVRRFAVRSISWSESNGRTIWIADAHRDDGKRFVVHADEKLRAFVELESRI
jgi:hypothetical protein